MNFSRSKRSPDLRNMEAKNREDQLAVRIALASEDIPPRVSPAGDSQHLGSRMTMEVS
jgi:hypothetical protein